jgi:hypothetical protein
MAGYGRVSSSTNLITETYLRFHIAILLGNARRGHILPNKVQPALKQVLVLVSPPPTDLLVVEVRVVPRVAIAPSVVHSTMEWLSTVKYVTKVVVFLLEIIRLLGLGGVEVLDRTSIPLAELLVSLLPTFWGRRIQVPPIFDKEFFFKALVQGGIV